MIDCILKLSNEEELVVLCLSDGRSLSKSVIASEICLPSKTLKKCLENLILNKVLHAIKQGGWVFYKLNEKHKITKKVRAKVNPIILPIKSCNPHTFSFLFRNARVCYNHLAGRLGTGVLKQLIKMGYISRVDGILDNSLSANDRLSSRGRDGVYQITRKGCLFFGDLGLDNINVKSVPYCCDRTEQKHHLSGALGEELTSFFESGNWIKIDSKNRIVKVTPVGIEGFHEYFGIKINKEEAISV